MALVSPVTVSVSNVKLICKTEENNEDSLLLLYTCEYKRQILSKENTIMTKHFVMNIMLKLILLDH